MPERKWRRVLRALLEKPSIHRFEAERYPVSDHCLPSTIAELQQRGIRVGREIIAVRGYGGGIARVANYHLDRANRERARRILKGAP